MTLCVIIPTYNNGGTLRLVVEGCLEYCKHVIVVNDGSTDDTGSVLDAMAGLVDVVEYRRNRGKGYALVQGFKRAKELGFSHAVTIDADGQHFPQDIPLFLDRLKGCPDGIIVGNRNLTEENMPRRNTFANRFSNFWFHLQTGIDLPDTQSGFRLYSLSSLHGLGLITSRYEAELELLVFAAWSGVRIVSTPVRVFYPPEGVRVSHFRPVYDFVRISILNTVLCLGALMYVMRQTAYTVFSFCYFLGLAFEMTLRGFFLITLGGGTREHKQEYHRMLQRRAKYVMAHIPGTTFSFSNAEGETFEKPSVIICNHQSHLDLMAVMMLTPNVIILTKSWVWHNPFYGLIIRYADFFPITDTEEMRANLQRKVEEGYSIMIFPEGTRSEDCSIQRFHRGAFYLAEQLGLDIVPVFIDGFGRVLPKKDFHLHPGHLSVEVMPRLHRDNPEEMSDYRSMAKRMRREYGSKV